MIRSNLRQALQVKAVPIANVRLLPGIFFDSMQIGKRVLLDLDVERMLYAYRFQAGLSTKGAKPYESWASPEPDGAFPGFYEAHYLSAICKMSAQTGDMELLKRSRYMVAELARCQQALGGRYLFASPEVEFKPNRLDGVIWYRMHKLLEGLVAARIHTQNSQALAILSRLTDWIEEQMTRYGAALTAVKKVEYGGMAEALANIYAITQNPKHLALAKMWEEPHILDAFAKGGDYREHANTLLAKIVGAARISEVDPVSEHLQSVRGFWDKVVTSGGRTYVTGGLSVHEGMPGQNQLAGTQSKMPQETCVSYNLVKVGHSLGQLTTDTRVIDHLERTLMNSILGSQDPLTGWKSYYQPLGANSVKDFRSNERGCYCCNGTGLENPSQYGQYIYSYAVDTVYINQFIASKVRIPGRGLELTQTTQFPYEAWSKLVISVTSPQMVTLAIRIPAWCMFPKIQVNGKPVRINKGDHWCRVARVWRTGDTVRIDLPMILRMESMPDKARQAAFMLGPLVLVGVGAKPWLSEVILYDVPGETIKGMLARLAARAKPTRQGYFPSLTFSVMDDRGHSLSLKPYFAVDGKTYFTGYFDVIDKPSLYPKGNVALGKPVLVADPHPVGVNVECFLRAEKCVDGNYGDADDWYVKWFPNGAEPQWVTVDLLEMHSITRTVWVTAKEDIDAKKAYRYRVDVSPDNKTWTLFSDRVATDNVGDSYEDVNNAAARYVRLTLTPRNLGGQNIDRPKISEFMVFGTRIP